MFVSTIAIGHGYTDLPHLYIEKMEESTWDWGVNM
jgi:hypothetical protein